MHAGMHVMLMYIDQLELRTMCHAWGSMSAGQLVSSTPATEEGIALDRTSVAFTLEQLETSTVEQSTCMLAR
jgi:hypothetical protein